MAGSYKNSNTASGAMTGAQVGANFGPWGAVIGAVVGGIAGYGSGKRMDQYYKQYTKNQDEQTKAFYTSRLKALGNFSTEQQIEKAAMNRRLTEARFTLQQEAGAAEGEFKNAVAAADVIGDALTYQRSAIVAQTNATSAGIEESSYTFQDNQARELAAAYDNVQTQMQERMFNIRSSILGKITGNSGMGSGEGLQQAVSIADKLMGSKSGSTSTTSGSGIFSTQGSHGPMSTSTSANAGRGVSAFNIK